MITFYRSIYRFSHFICSSSLNFHHSSITSCLQSSSQFLSTPTSISSTPSSITSHVNSMTNRSIQNFDYFLALDFEATCDEPIQLKPMEIIEFPVIKVNAKTFEIEERFHKYVRPVVHPKLTPFCTQLTGIIQDMVDDQPTFEQVFNEFQLWMSQVGLVSPTTYLPLSRFTFVTIGNWDLSIALTDQCKLFKLEIPLYLKSWINVKKSFSDATGKWPKSMNSMMEHLELTHVGRLHSGIDDCRNLVSIIKSLNHKYEFVFKNTSANWM